MNFYDPEGWEAHEARMAGPWPDDEVTEVDDTDACAYFDAADGGEETEDMEGRDYHDVPDDEPKDWNQRLDELLDEATDLQLKAGKYAFERKQAQRIEQAQATIRALDPNAPKPRARRSDAGKPRASRALPSVSDNSNALEAERQRAVRDEKGVAV